MLGSVIGTGSTVVEGIQSLPVKWEMQTLRSTILVGGKLCNDTGSPEGGRVGRGEEGGRKGMPCVFRPNAEETVHDLLLFLQAKAQKVLQKLGDVQEIFHKRQMSLMKLAARQTRPVQPVAPHPESSPKWVSPKTSQPSALGRLFGE